MKHPISLVAAIYIAFSLAGCSSGNQPQNGTKADSTKTSTSDKEKGIGKFTNVRLTHPLDDSMVSRGQVLFDSKCMSCHKLTDEKLVGPGWKGVTDRRTPEWIMNFITNTNVMLDSDLVAQQLMVVCLTRMPNQNLSDDQARAILEFMRKNDGKK